MSSEGIPGRVLVKDGVLFTVIAPGGFRLLAAIEGVARITGRDLVVTSACDGIHAGASDPHHRGEAYDIRTHGLSDAQKDGILESIIQACSDGLGDPALAVSGIARSCATRRFFGRVEKPNTDAEHIHVQLRRGARY